jgi:hypothetical protein
MYVKECEYMIGDDSKLITADENSIFPFILAYNLYASSPMLNCYMIGRSYIMYDADFNSIKYINTPFNHNIGEINS